MGAKTLNKSVKILIPMVTIVLILGATILIIRKAKPNTTHDSISATVTSVVDRPNQAEDGFYQISAKDSSGHTYTIDATGYMNTPQTPDAAGQACVAVPKLQSGDKITFNLPLASGKRDSFVICYQKGLQSYSFTVVK